MSDRQTKRAPTDLADRQAWLGTLARAPAAALAEAWAGLNPKPGYRCVRGPETGLIMVRGRAGGTGQRFNVGEATVTRCTVALDDGLTGTSYALGRDRERALYAALFDALLQDPARRTVIERDLLDPVRGALVAKESATARKAAATRVDFFTVAREGSE